LGHPLRKKSIFLHLGEIWTNRFGGIKKNREEIVSVFNNNSNCATLLYYLREPFERMNLMLFDFFFRHLHNFHDESDREKKKSTHGENK
jgi:hypothetical protein